MLPFHDIWLIATESIRRITNDYSEQISPSDTLQKHGITSDWQVDLLINAVDAQLRNRGFTLVRSHTSYPPPKTTVSSLCQFIASSALPGDETFEEPVGDSPDTSSGSDDY